MWLSWAKWPAVGIVGIGLVASYFLIAPTDAYQISRSKLLANCQSFSWADDANVEASIDAENGIAVVRKFSEASTSLGDSSASVVQEIVLPLKKNVASTSFGRCSAPARKMMDRLQADYDEYIRESCTDFRNVLAGRKPVPIKNGKRANLEGARKFVRQFCS